MKYHFDHFVHAEEVLLSGLVIVCCVFNLFSPNLKTFSTIAVPGVGHTVPLIHLSRGCIGAKGFLSSSPPPSSELLRAGIPKLFTATSRSVLNITNNFGGHETEIMIKKCLVGGQSDFLLKWINNTLRYKHFGKTALI